MLPPTCLEHEFDRWPALTCGGDHVKTPAYSAAPPAELILQVICVVPVLKKKSPSGPNNYHPVALTSLMMKVLERLVLAHLRPQVKSSLDPLQFAYQPHLGVDAAIIHLLQRAHSHLDCSGSTVRITFFDFSSAFNTIQPLLLGEKLRVMGVDASQGPLQEIIPATSHHTVQQ